MKKFETMWSRRLLLLVSITLAMAALSLGALPARGQGFTFTDFSSIPNSNLKLNGDAAQYNGNVLRLIHDGGGFIGTAWYTTPQPVSGGFKTTFTFQITHAGFPADGIAFVIQNDVNGTTAGGGGGGDIGYAWEDYPGHTMTNNLAVEFDTYYNPGFDQDANHIAIQNCGSGPNSSNESATYGGNIPCNLGVTPTNALANIYHLTLADGNPHTFEIDYEPNAVCNVESTGTLNVNLLTNGGTTSTNLLSACNVNLANRMSLGTGGTAFVGFTGSSGASFENDDLLNWQFTPTTIPGNQISSDNAGSLMQQFVFNSTAGKQVEFDFDYSTANTASTLTIAPSTVPQVINQAENPSLDYPLMVAGTALAETNCLVDPGQLDAKGNASCPMFTIQCTNANSAVFAGDNCPQSTARNILFKHVISTTAPNIPGPVGDHYYAVTAAMGSDNWSPVSGSCAFVGPEAGQLCPKSPATQFADCCKGPNMTVPHSNSSFIAGCCEREWSTVPTMPLWSNSTSVPVSFMSTPPNATDPVTGMVINGYRPAPGQSVTYGYETPGGAALDPTFPIAGDVTLKNPIPPSTDPNAPCGSSNYPLTWSSQAVGFPTSDTILNVPEGAHELHFFSTDCDDMEELVFTSSSNPGQKWASFKTKLFNVDLTKPTITGPTLSTTTPLPGQVVTATYSCADPLSNGVASGVATCGTHTFGGVPSTGTLTSTFPATGTGPQTYSVTATDVAGNTFTASTPYSVNYAFEGFFLPVANAPAVNKINDRTIVPLVFQVEKAAEAEITGLKLASAGGTVSITASNSNSLLCTRHVPASSIPITSLFNSGLLGLGDGFYLFAWTTNLPSGACVDLSVNVGDGVSHDAIFQAR
jgi:hypothetical protein